MRESFIQGRDKEREREEDEDEDLLSLRSIQPPRTSILYIDFVKVEATYSSSQATFEKLHVTKSCLGTTINHVSTVDRRGKLRGLAAVG